mmetsp:Transcript_97896/g.281256  ORF Transcript_97896/g.281256 Transcript_97896/m.281256 type:complete len:249 (-) Transcript_97896:123-869(-)
MLDRLQHASQTSRLLGKLSGVIPALVVDEEPSPRRVVQLPKPLQGRLASGDDDVNGRRRNGSSASVNILESASQCQIIAAKGLPHWKHLEHRLKRQRSLLLHRGNIALRLVGVGLGLASAREGQCFGNEQQRRDDEARATLEELSSLLRSRGDGQPCGLFQGRRRREAPVSVEADKSPLQVMRQNLGVVAIASLADAQPLAERPQAAVEKLLATGEVFVGVRTLGGVRYAGGVDHLTVSRPAHKCVLA